MKRIHLMAGAICATVAVAGAETIRLSDGTALEGGLGAPTEIEIKTVAGEAHVSFSQLPAAVQARYWRVAAGDDETLAVATNPQQRVVTVEDIATLANEVNLDTWQQIAAIGSFRDRAEKRGSGGLVVTKAFNALEENWVSVYSPKDPVGAAGNWDRQLVRARELQASAHQFIQRRWLEVFIKAAEAVARRDSNDFALQVRELKRSSLPTASLENPRNFFAVK